MGKQHWEPSTPGWAMRLWGGEVSVGAHCRLPMECSAGVPPLWVFPDSQCPTAEVDSRARYLSPARGTLGSLGRETISSWGSLAANFPLVFTHGFGGQGTPAFQEAVREHLSTAVKSTKKKKKKASHNYTHTALHTLR